MIDLVLPKPSNEKEFIKIAEKLDLTGLVFCYDLTDSKTYHESKKRIESHSSKIKLYLGQIVTEKTKKFFPLPKILIAPKDVRGAFERVKADYIANLELQDRKDYLHHRASGMNHIIATIGSKKNKSMVVFSSNLLFSDSALYIGRIRQNLMLARKSGLNCVLVSGATDPWHLRSRSEMVSLGVFLGTKLTVGLNIN